MNYSILIYCRSGFESEASQEIIEKAKFMQVTGYIKAKPNSAYVLFYPHESDKCLELWKSLNIHNLIFARQVLFCFANLTNLPENNRIEPIYTHAQQINEFLLLQNISLINKTFDKMFVEVPDTNEHKELLNFCKKFTTPLQIYLEKKAILKRVSQTPEYSFHILFLDSSTCYLAVGNQKKCSPYFMGIPRLKFPVDAPSRSTLKLEEAFLFFMTENQRKLCLKNGMQAVDLGASPGGWTFQFVQLNILVTAVDNAQMDKKLMESGLVNHIQQDGFKYTPPKPVHWMVCDMVEKPSRIIKLILHWAQFRYAQNFIFNLKLPMKKRADEIKQCMDELKNGLENYEGHYFLECKQLYHDREEVTVWLRLE